MAEAKHQPRRVILPTGVQRLVKASELIKFLHAALVELDAVDAEVILWDIDGAQNVWSHTVDGEKCYEDSDDQPTIHIATYQQGNEEGENERRNDEVLTLTPTQIVLEFFCSNCGRMLAEQVAANERVNEMNVPICPSCQSQSFDIKPIIQAEVD